MPSFSLAASFLAGFAGFASPCVLPLVPAYLSYISGIGGRGGKDARGKMLANTAAFVSGLALALSALGFLLGSMLEYLSGEMLLLASRISGGLMVVFGLYILGFLRLGFFEARRGLMLPQSASLSASFSIGVMFAIVWTPLMGAFLAFVIALAISQPGDAPALLFSYACGLGLPFLLVGAFASQAASFIRRHGKAMAVFDRAMGLMVVIIGFLLLAGSVPFS